MSKHYFLLLLAAIGFAFAGCDELFVAGQTRSGYYDDNVDFYYTGQSPYSRQYGPLVYRDNRYYYRRAGGLVIYDRPTYAYSQRGRSIRHERREDYRDRRDRRDDRHDRWDDRRDHDRDRGDYRRDDDVRDGRRRFF